MVKRMTKSRKFISQADLAKKLQLNSSTVSLALSGHPRIPAETQMRVKALAKKLGYKADVHATRLAAKRWTNGKPKSWANIAYLQCHIHRGKADQYLPGLLRQADALGYHLDVLNSWEFTGNDHLNKVLYSRGVKGVVVGKSASNFRPYVPPLEKIAVVQCGLYWPVEIFTLVRSDLDAVVRLCFEKVRSQNFRRIGMVLLHNPRAESDRILENSIWNLKRIHPDNIEVFIEKWTSFDTYSVSLKKWFYRHKLDVVIGVNALVHGILEHLGIKVPFACMIHDPHLPQFDGADLQCAIMGEMSINLLDSYLRQNLLDNPPIKKVFMVEPVWHEGTTLSRRRVP